MNSECQKRWGGRPSKSYTAWLQAMGCRRSFTSSFTSLFLIYLGIFSGMYWRQMTHAQPLLRDPHTSRSLTNHSLAIQAFSEYIAPLPVPDPGFPPRRRGCLWCLGRWSLRSPNPAFVLILAALAPPISRSRYCSCWRGCPCRSRRSGRQSRLLAAIKLVQGTRVPRRRGTST